MKNHYQSKKAIWTRWIVIGLLMATTILDFFTFAIAPKFWVYDISPLVVLTKNIWILFGVKFFVVGLLIYMLLKKSKANDYVNFLWILCAVYLIIFQGVGAISNTQVSAANPDPADAPPPQEMAKIGFNFALLYAYYPLMFSMLGFWLWNWGWRDERN